MKHKIIKIVTIAYISTVCRILSDINLSYGKKIVVFLLRHSPLIAAGWLLFLPPSVSRLRQVEEVLEDVLRQFREGSI